MVAMPRDSGAFYRTQMSVPRWPPEPAFAVSLLLRRASSDTHLETDHERAGAVQAARTWHQVVKTQGRTEVPS